MNAQTDGKEPVFVIGKKTVPLSRMTMQSLIDDCINDDPAVYNSMHYTLRNEMTAEQALVLCIRWLLEHKAALLKECMELRMKQPIIIQVNKPEILE